MSSNTSSRYRLALAAWPMAGIVVLLVLPVALLALIVAPLQPVLADAGALWARVPRTSVLAVLAVLWAARYLTARVPNASAARHAQRVTRLRIAVTRLSGDAAALALLALIWGVFRVYGIPLWQRLRWPAFIGESLEYLLAMGVAVVWVFALAGALAQAWRWVRNR